MSTRNLTRKTSPLALIQVESLIQKPKFHSFIHSTSSTHTHTHTHWASMHTALQINSTVRCHDVFSHFLCKNIKTIGILLFQCPQQVYCSLLFSPDLQLTSNYPLNNQWIHHFESITWQKDNKRRKKMNSNKFMNL